MPVLQVLSPVPRSRWLTLRSLVPSTLTTFRYFSPIPLLWLFLTGHAVIFTLAAIALALTDWLDGKLARMWDCTTVLGAEFDITADKIMCTLFLSIGLTSANSWQLYTPLILLVIYHVAVIWMRYTKSLLFKASRVAKVKMFIEMPTLIAAFAFAGDFGMPWINDLGRAFLWPTALLAIWSMCHYVGKLPDWPARFFPKKA
jgi:phosphatidylglycerophosphate synthase